MCFFCLLKHFASRLLGSSSSCASSVDGRKTKCAAGSKPNVVFFQLGWMEKRSKPSISTPGDSGSFALLQGSTMSAGQGFERQRRIDVDDGRPPAALLRLVGSRGPTEAADREPRTEGGGRRAAGHETSEGGSGFFVTVGGSASPKKPVSKPKQAL